MKIRVGFVSNSSSSSFVCFIDQDVFNKALAETHPYTKAVIEALIPEKGIKAFGKTFVSISSYDSHGYGPYDSISIDEAIAPPDDDERDAEEYIYEALDIFLAEVKKIDKQSILTHSQDL